MRSKLEMFIAIMEAADKRTITEIAKIANINNAPLKVMLDILEHQRLIVKERSREFVRGNGEMVIGSLRDRYELTDAGRMLLPHMKEVHSILPC